MAHHITFEHVRCYQCGADDPTHLVHANEDLTGKPGTFTFVTCNGCGLAYQNPRVVMDEIGFYYDSEYIAHRKKTDWGFLQRAYDWAMGKYDRDKCDFVAKYVDLGPDSRILDVGCAVGSFLTMLKERVGSHIVGVDFKDCSYYPGFDQIEFHQGLFYDQTLPPGSFDLITMWHFLEHDYDPMRSLRLSRELLAPGGRVIIEVPRFGSRTWRWFRERWPGLQAPQHTVLFDKEHLLHFCTEAGFEVVEQHDWGVFPAYFYMFTGLLFKRLKGRGIDMNRWVLPYFIGQVLTLPITLFEKRLNLAMQTVVLKLPDAQ